MKSDIKWQQSLSSSEPIEQREKQQKLENRNGNKNNCIYISRDIWGDCIREDLDKKKKETLRENETCSSHRSIFSRKSMPPPSDSATHRPISGQSALIPSTTQ